MKIRLGTLMLAAALIVPCSRLWADTEKTESPKEERTESREHQQAEEREAMEHHQKKVAKFGKDSAEAKKAWRHVVGEYKEHGDTPPAQTEAVPAPTAVK